MNLAKTVKRIVWRFFVYLRLSTSSTMKVASPVSTAVKLSKSVKVKYIRRHLLSESDETAMRCSYSKNIIFSITSQGNLITFTHNSTLPGAYAYPRYIYCHVNSIFQSIQGLFVLHTRTFPEHPTPFTEPLGPPFETR